MPKTKIQLKIRKLIANRSSLVAFFRASHESGFTVIELLVVFAAIGFIASIIIVSLSGVKAKSRDSRRVADIKTMRAALDSYYLANKRYPLGAAGNCAASIDTLLTEIDVVNTALKADGLIKTPVLDPMKNITVDSIEHSIYYNACADAQSTGGKVPDPNPNSASRHGEYYAITFVLETNSLVKQGYVQGVNCVGSRLSGPTASLPSIFNGSNTCNVGP